MGTWGDDPWENDAAADWFGDVFDKTGFAEQVAAGLHADIDDCPEIVRAAAHLVFLLGRVYVWPIDRHHEDLQLAANRLEQLLERDWEPTAALRKEIRAIKSRLKSIRETRARTKSGRSSAVQEVGQGPPIATEIRSQEMPAAKTPVKKLRGYQSCGFAWMRDLATVEQRKNASTYRWGILPPSVNILKPVGKNQLLVGTGQHLRLIDTTDGTTIRDLAEGEKPYAGISSGELVTRNGLFVVIDAERSMVRKLTDGKVVFSREKLPRSATTVISSDGRRLIDLTWDGVLHVYDVERGGKLFELEHEPPKRPEDAFCAVSPEGLRAASSWKGSVCFWDLEAGTLIRKQRNKYAGVRFTSDGKEAVTRGGTGRVLWDVATGKKIRTISGPVVSDTLISPKNRYVCEVSPFKLHAQQGEVCLVRDWTAEDVPYLGAVRADFAWFGDEQVAAWRDVKEEGRIATCEARLWSLHPFELVGAFQVDPPLLPIENEPQPVRRPVQFYRIATAADEQMIFAGDGNAHVYAFQIGP